MRCCTGHLSDNVFWNLEHRLERKIIVKGKLPASRQNCNFLKAAVTFLVVVLVTTRVIHYGGIRALSKMNDIECSICVVLIDKLDRWWEHSCIDRIQFQLSIEAAEFIPGIERGEMATKRFVDIGLGEGNEMIIALQVMLMREELVAEPAMVENPSV